MPKKSKPRTKSKNSKASMRKVKKSGGGGRCWSGYKPTPGKKAYSKGSCMKK